MKFLVSRYIYLLILSVIIISGLLSKKISGAVSEIIDIKDVIWSLMVYFLVRIIFIKWRIKQVALTGIIFSILIEISQLYHSGWIDKLRNTFMGSVILGSAFVWTDLIAYTIGILLGMAIDNLVIISDSKAKQF